MSSFSHAGSAPAPRRHALALWTVLAAQLMLAMDFLIVVVALPRIQQDLGFSGAGLTWVPNAFGLAFGGLLLLGGRLGDMIARYGGDEFVALLAPIGDANAVEAVVARMMTGVETAAERVLPEPLRVSAGYACWPAHGSSLTELLRKADAAMYRAKDKAQ